MTALLSGHRFILTINVFMCSGTCQKRTSARMHSWLMHLTKSTAMYQGYRFKRWPSLDNVWILPNTSASRRGRPNAPNTIDVAAVAATHVS